jgi:hypothetical protein
VRRRLVAFLAIAVAIAGCTTGGSPVIERRSGGQPSTSSMTSPKPERRSQHWLGTIASTSEHRLYVGGTCVSDWRTRLVFTVTPTGRVTGSGSATLASKGDPCPFPVATRQIRGFGLRVTGTMRGGRLQIRLTETGSTPSAGADDLGGFRWTTLSTVLTVRTRAASAAARIELHAPDQDRGDFGSVNVVRLRCRNC